MKKMNLKHLSILCLTIFLASSVKAAARCTACDAATKTTKALQKLNYKNDDDRFKGGELALEGVKQLQEFAKISKADPNRKKIFSDLLTLIREAGPYDGESQLAEVLADTIKSDQTLKTAYTSFLKSLPKPAPKSADLCKTGRMQSSIDEALCRIEGGVDSQDSKDVKVAAKAKSCIKPFNFEECLK